MIHLPSKIFAVMCLLHFITLETPFSVAYLNGFKPKMYCRSYVTMNTDQVPLSQSRSIMPSIAKKSLFGFGSLLSIALLKRERAIAIDLPECSDSVTIFRRSADNREIIMIGTAHISEESANLVRRTIKKVQPDVVMIELDPKRIGRVAGNQTLEEAGFDLPAGSRHTVPELEQETTPIVEKNFVTKWMDSFANTLSVWVQNAVTLTGNPLGCTPNFFSVPSLARTKTSIGGALLGRVLSQFYKSVEKLGFVAGGEFKAAVEEGRAIGARILLGDRDVDITLSRLATAVSDSKSESFDRVVAKISSIEKDAGLNLPISDNEEISKDTLTSFIESVKQKELLTSVLGAVKEELPEVYAALIGERDDFMAEAVASSPGVNLVGVVGMAHMGGIERYLTGRKGFSVVMRNCPPSK